MIIYPKEFESGSIKAAFLELPYLKVFLEEYSGYTAVGLTYRFGGLGFVSKHPSCLILIFVQTETMKSSFFMTYLVRKQTFLVRLGN